jgi:hypothetical protein
MPLRLLIAIIEIPAAAIEGIVRIVAGALAILRVRLHRPYDYRRWLARDLADCETILELGCGRNSPVLQVGLGKRTVAFDIWMPYVTLHNERGDYLTCKQADILTMELPHKTYDAVVVCDVLEHLPREQVERIPDLFDLMETCARKRVVIFTPNGFVENDHVDDDPYQAHVSSWEPEDYTRRGYTVKGATGVRWVLGKASLPKWHPYSLWAIVAMVSQPYIYNHPQWAWHSYAVKEL